MTGPVDSFDSEAIYIPAGEFLTVYVGLFSLFDSDARLLDIIRRNVRPDLCQCKIFRVLCSQT